MLLLDYIVHNIYPCPTVDSNLDIRCIAPSLIILTKRRRMRGAGRRRSNSNPRAEQRTVVMYWKKGRLPVKYDMINSWNPKVTMSNEKLQFCVSLNFILYKEWRIVFVMKLDIKPPKMSTSNRIHIIGESASLTIYERNDLIMSRSRYPSRRSLLK